MRTNRTHLLTLAACLVSTSLLAVTVTVGTSPAGCGACNGTAVATPSGGLPPYTYDWSPAPAAGQGTANPQGLCAGDWTVTVTDGLGNTAQGTGTVESTTSLNMPSGYEMLSDCMGSCSGWFAIDENTLGGTAPYTYDFPFPQVNGSQVIFMGVCSGFPGTMITATDANGCAVTFTAWVNSNPGGWPDIDYILPECGSNENGVVALLDNYFTGAWYKVSNATFDSIYEFAAPPYIITGLPAGSYNVVLWDPSNPMIIGGGPVYCTFETAVTVPSIAPPCGSISGTVYHDADQDCVMDPTDYPQPYRIMTIQPGPAYAISGGDGHYQQNLSYGSYDLSQSAVPQEIQVCPVTAPVPFTIDAANSNVVADFSNLSTVPHDIVVGIWTGNARPGFPTSAYVILSNTTAFPSGQVTLTLTFDPMLQNPSPASGQWVLPSVPPYSNGVHYFNALVPANINLLGTVLNYSVTATNTASELNTVNNTATAAVTITGSYDPNDKQGKTSSRASDEFYFLNADTYIDYTVRFQNTGTAAAETVVVRDLIDEDMFIPSLEILGASHSFTPSFGEGRELVFTFDGINLPDSSADLLGSQGFVSFRLKPNSDIIVGDVLENTAGIYFDLNPPIITNTVSHVVDFSTGTAEVALGTLRLLPNPTNDVLNVVLVDGSNGSFQLLSADGRALQVPVLRRGTSVQLDVHSLTPGIYIVRTPGSSARFMKN